jgi:hypothetical protein
MVRKVQIVLADDLDGAAADETVRFSVDGKDYEIDLNAGHAEELRRTLAEFIKAGRKVGGSPRRTSGASRGGSAGGPDPSEVREWAKGQGIVVKDRGRVPAELVVKFKAATDA